jgi:hypothetical protein
VAAPIGRRKALQVVVAGVPLAALARAGETSAELPVSLQMPQSEPDLTPAAPLEAPAEAPVARVAREAPRVDAVPAASSVLPELVPGLRIGSCTVLKVGEVVAGGIPVLLQAPNGSQFGVDILRHDRRTPGVARGGRLAVYLNNGGTGGTASNETHGLGAMALAGWLARRESHGCPVPSLLTLKQRAPLLAVLQA